MDELKALLSEAPQDAECYRIRRVASDGKPGVRQAIRHSTKKGGDEWQRVSKDTWQLPSEIPPGKYVVQYKDSEGEWGDNIPLTIGEDVDEQEARRSDASNPLGALGPPPTDPVAALAWSHAHLAIANVQLTREAGRNYRFAASQNRELVAELAQSSEGGEWSPETIAKIAEAAPWAIRALGQGLGAVLNSMKDGSK